MDKDKMKIDRLKKHQNLLSKCSQCPDMVGPAITGNPVLSRVMSVGQAPGVREGEFQRPFAWTAGKTLFSWFKETLIKSGEIFQFPELFSFCIKIE